MPAELDSRLPSPEAATHDGALNSLPVLLLNVHRHCNCRCLMCDIWKRPRDGSSSAELDPAELERHRASFQTLGVREVVLTGGEPLLHTRLEALCRFLRECGVRITLLTSGLLLAKRAAVAVLADEIIVSLDGPEAVHDRIRGVRQSFALIRDGIQAVRSLCPKIPVHARSTVQRLNGRFLRETVAAAHGLGFDSISFLPADLTSQAFNRELVWPGERQAEVAFTRTELIALESEIEQLIVDCFEDISTGYIRESAPKLRRIGTRFREHLDGLAPQSPLCNAPWVSAVLELDGSLRPCFFHPVVARLGDMTLQEAINTSAARHFRQTLDVAADPVCRRCVCSLNYRRPTDSRRGSPAKEK